VAGAVVTPATLGVLASVGAVAGPVFGQPRVNVVATGNELVDPHRTPEPGQIRNSNGPMLEALAVSAGAEATQLDILRDDPDEMRRVIGGALASDVLILAGGVSVGKFDLVPQVLEELGVAVHVRQVRMKPGKPLLFGTRDRTLVFGLPGNPVSAFVCIELFARPALRALAGDPEPGPRVTSLPMAEPVAEANDRPTYRPAKLEFTPTGLAVRPLPWLGAPDLRGLRPADALLVLPPGEARMDAGQVAPAVVLG
jgi:molybdopterin molybdotransferase